MSCKNYSLLSILIFFLVLAIASLTKAEIQIIKTYENFEDEVGRITTLERVFGQLIGLSQKGLVILGDKVELLENRRSDQQFFLSTDGNYYLILDRGPLYWNNIYLKRYDSKEIFSCSVSTGSTRSSEDFKYGISKRFLEEREEEEKEEIETETEKKVEDFPKLESCEDLKNFYNYSISPEGKLIVAQRHSQSRDKNRYSYEFGIIDGTGKLLKIIPVNNPNEMLFAKEQNLFFLNSKLDGLDAYDFTGNLLWHCEKPFQYYACSKDGTTVAGAAFGYDFRMIFIKNGEILSVYNDVEQIKTVNISENGRYAVCATTLKACLFDLGASEGKEVSAKNKNSPPSVQKNDPKVNIPPRPGRLIFTHSLPPDEGYHIRSISVTDDGTMAIGVFRDLIEAKRIVKEGRYFASIDLVNVAGQLLSHFELYNSNRAPSEVEVDLYNHGNNLLVNCGQRVYILANK